MELLLFALVGVALGAALGLFGGGGGMLAIPLLVAVGVPPDEAGTTSLLVVGIGALGGLVPHARAGRVAWREGLLFALFGIAGAVLGSKAALATDDRLQLWAFAVVLVVAGTLMLRNALRSDAEPSPGSIGRERRGAPVIVAAAVSVGLFTGFFGVGGGFLVVPALTLVLGMSMYRATATALLVIAINSAAALVPRAGEALDVGAAVVVTVGVLLSSALAARWSNRWSSRNLGVGFGVLALAMFVLTLTQASHA